MIIERHKMAAAASAKFCRRSSLVRALAACLVCCAAVPAVAAAGDKERDGPRNGPQERREAQARQAPPVQPRQAEPLRNDMRQFDQRAFEARAEEHRRMLQMQQEQNVNNADASRRGGRLTADERRDLRRQINEAGNDLYANPKRR